MALEEPKKDVITDPSTVTPQEEKKENQPAVPEQKPPHGYVPLEALKEEREKRKALETRIEKLEEDLRSSQDTEDENDFLDDSKELKKEISSLREELGSIKESFTKKDLEHQYSWVKDKWEDIEEFRKEYPRTSLDKIVKLFALENDLLVPSQPQRQGLEKPTSGAKVPQSSGLSKEDVKRLREDNPRQYLDWIRSGKLKAEDIV